MRLQVLDPHAKFACSGCGWCCDQPWATVISTEDAARYDAVNWAADFPNLAGRKLYRKVRRNGETVLELTKSSGNRCIFLDADNRCRVHATLGMDAKPHMCRQFPYLPVNTAQDQRVSVNYGCRAVQNGHGGELDEQLAEIRATVRPPADAPRNEAKVALTPEISIPFGTAQRLLARLSDVFRPEEGTPLLAALAWCLELVEFATGCEPAELHTRLAADSSLPRRNSPTPQPSHELPPAALPMPSRLLFAATLYPDIADPRSLGLLQRFALVPKLMSLTQLRGGYASRILARNVDVGAGFAASAARSLLSAESTALLKRYLQARLWQNYPAGTQRSILSGLHQHVLDLAAVVFYARVLAASGDYGACALATGDAAGVLPHDAVARGLNIVEFHFANQERLIDRVLQGWFAAALGNLDVARASLNLVRVAAPASAALRS